MTVEKIGIALALGLAGLPCSGVPAATNFVTLLHASSVPTVHSFLFLDHIGQESKIDLYFQFYTAVQGKY